MSVLDLTNEALEAIPAVQLAVAFGSVARGEGHSRSDLDLGLLLDPTSSDLAARASMATPAGSGSRRAWRAPEPSRCNRPASPWEPATRPGTAFSALLLLGAGLLTLGCTPGVFLHNADLGLPFEAFPQTEARPSCSVLFSSTGPLGRLGDFESYVDRTTLVGETAAEQRRRLHELLGRAAETIWAGEHMIGHVWREEWMLNPLSIERATEQTFLLYASCLTEEGAFHCRQVPMGVELESSAVCPFSPFRFGAEDAAAAAPQAIEIDYTSVPCTKAYGVHRKSCQGGWLIRIHHIRLSGG